VVFELAVGIICTEDKPGIFEPKASKEGELVGVVFAVVGFRDGVGVVGVGDGDGPGASEESIEPEPAFELPALKTTMLAVSPRGTVTTQKLAPPAPDA